MSFRVTAHYYVERDNIAAVRPLLKDLAVASRTEPGNLDYIVAENIETEGHFVITETYGTEDDFAAHRETAHFQQIGVGKIIPLLKDRVIERATVLD